MEETVHNTQSCTDFGTLYQLRNFLTGGMFHQNPEKDVNASENFLNLVVTAHFLVACGYKVT